MNPRQNTKRHNFTGQNATKGCHSKKKGENRSPKYSPTPNIAKILVTLFFNFNSVAFRPDAG